MTKTIVTSPVAGLNASTAIGPLNLRFEKGVAEVDSEDITKGVRLYLEENGYAIGEGNEPTPRQKEQPQPPDPRKVSTEQVGTKIRDAAVDPREKDFLEPTNAGDANPHGTQVVNPEIHAAETGIVVPGVVGDTEYQHDKESAVAELTRAGTPTPVPTAMKAIAQALDESDSEKSLTPEERDLLGLPPVEEGDADSEVADHELKGEALDAKLDELGLSKDGTADERRDRIRIFQTPAEELKGADLDTALREADLPVSGSAEERHARVQEYRDSQVGA